jgi:hypothetical protein
MKTQIYVGANHTLFGKAAQVMRQEDHVLAKFNDVKTGFGYGWHKFQTSDFISISKGECYCGCERIFKEATVVGDLVACCSICGEIVRGREAIPVVNPYEKDVYSRSIVSIFCDKCYQDLIDDI